MTAHHTPDPKRLESEHKKNERLIVIWTIVIGFFTFVIAVTSGISDFIFFKQLKEMQSGAEQTKATIDALQEANRAWMVVDARPNLRVRDFTADKVSVDMEMSNLGKEPADNMIYYPKPGRYLPIKSTDKNDMHIPPSEDNCQQTKAVPGNVIFPNHSIVETEIVNLDSNPELAALWHKGKAVYYYGGCVAYKTLGITHHTEFCYRFYYEPSENTIYRHQCDIDNHFD